MKDEKENTQPYNEEAMRKLEEQQEQFEKFTREEMDFFEQTGH